MLNTKNKAKRGNGSGTLYQRGGTGNWIAEWYSVNGNRKTRSTRTTSSVDAERIMRGWVERSVLERESLIKPEGGTETDRHMGVSLTNHPGTFQASKRGSIHALPAGPW